MANKRRVKRKIDKRPKNNDNNNEKKLEGYAIKLVAQFLHPSDILKCIQTCQQWKKEINEEVWIAVAKNISPSSVAAMEPNGTGTALRLDYKTMALALATPPPTEANSRMALIERSTLRLEDFVLVVEIRHVKTKKNIGAWSVNLNEFAIEFDEEKSLDIFEISLD